MKINNNTIAKTIGVVVMSIFLLSILTACASEPKKPKEISPIADAKLFGKTLGCVVAPNTCQKTPEQKQKEQDEITKEFNKVDQDQAQSTSK